jgi:membrane protein YdbS with pleckstrin-like domain
VTDKTPTEYWFARRFPIGHARRGMAPVHWKGWLASVAFVVGLFAAAAAGYWLYSIGEVTRGVVAFSAGAFLVAIWFIGISHKKGDHVHTVADYREGKVRV